MFSAQIQGKIKGLFTFAAGSLAVSLIATPAFADDIENLFSQEPIEAIAPTPTPLPEASANTDKPRPDGGPAIRGVGDLGKLESFDDIAVIQKRFLPRTERFEIFLGPTVVLNDAYFLNFGGQLRLAYHFNERYGIEGVGTYLSTNERQFTSDLRSQRDIRTQSFVTPQNYFGLDFKWSPIYGKMTWANKRITPFDLYFSAGAGMTGTNQNSNEFTLHLGTGQIFATTKSFAWRWDFSWHAFRASSNLVTNNPPTLYHNLLLTLGASFYFPEASYR